MASILPLRALAVFLFTAMLFAPRLPAQNGLVAEIDGKGQEVKKVVGGRAFIEKDGKVVAASGARRYALRPVPEFMPASVSVRDIRVSTSHTELIGQAAEINQAFNFRAEFLSSYVLEDVFLVLELNLKHSDKLLFFYEVGDLGPDKVVPLNLRVPTPGGLGEGQGRYQLHLFAGGREVFNSQQPVGFRDKMLNRMVAARIADVKDAPPRPFFGPAPEYPKPLKKAGVKGQAMVTIRIARTGEVLDPVVKSATDPAFGEAALAAVRLWRFLPKVENGQAVEMTVDLPFAFDPAREEKKS